MNNSLGVVHITTPWPSYTLKAAELTTSLPLYVRMKKSSRFKLTVEIYTYVFPSITNKMQRYTIYLFLWKAVHVSGGSTAHHQELKTVYTASGTLSNLYCYLPLSISSTTLAVSSKRLTKYRMLYIQFWAPDDRRRNRLKHVEHFTEIYKLCNVASLWLCLEIYLRCTDPWTSNVLTCYVDEIFCSLKFIGSVLWSRECEVIIYIYIFFFSAWCTVVNRCGHPSGSLKWQEFLGNQNHFSLHIPWAEETEIPKVPHQDHVDIYFFRLSRRSAQRIRTRGENNKSRIL